MTQRGDIPFGPDSIPPSQQSRIHAAVDDLLTNLALTDDDADARIGHLLDNVLPESAPAPAATVTRPTPPPPLEAWAQDQAPQSPPPPLVPPAAPAAAGLSPSAPNSTATPGGGQVQPIPVNPTRTHAPDPGSSVPTPNWEDRYGLWSPPAPAELVVPDDVAAIAPVDPRPAPRPPPALTPRSFTPTHLWPTCPRRRCHQTRQILAPAFSGVPGADCPPGRRSPSPPRWR